MTNEIDNDQLFYEALEENSISKMRLIPKSDIHNHVGRGGSIEYLGRNKGVKIPPLETPFDTLGDMQEWFEKYIKIHYPGSNGYLERVKASFIQGNEDGIELLAMSYGIGEIYNLIDMPNFIAIMNQYQMCAPKAKFYPELVLSSSGDLGKDLEELDYIFSFNYFRSVDWQGSELNRDIQSIKPMFQKAKDYNLKLKAHVGEFGTAEHIRECVEELMLDEIHHGINAVEDVSVMKLLVDRQIQLNFCPTSNIMLKRSKSYEEHQIRKLVDFGVKVTINSDDLCIFNSSVSDEYLLLYNRKALSGKELNVIRMNGLRCYD